MCWNAQETEKERDKIQHGKCLFIFLFSLTGKPKERERRIQLRKIEKWYCRVREIKSKTFKSFWEWQGRFSSKARPSSLHVRTWTLSLSLPPGNNGAILFPYGLWFAIFFITKKCPGELDTYIWLELEKISRLIKFL